MGLPLRERVKHFFLALVDYAKYVTQQPRTATARSYSLFRPLMNVKLEKMIIVNTTSLWWRMRTQSGVNLGNRMGRLVIT